MRLFRLSFLLNKEDKTATAAKAPPPMFSATGSEERAGASAWPGKASAPAAADCS